MNLYLIYYNFSLLKFGICYKLNIERETEAMYYGSLSHIDETKRVGNFSLQKEKINRVIEKVSERNEFFLCIHLFAENKEEACNKALRSIFEYLIHKARQMYVDSDLFTIPKRFVLRKGFKDLLDAETKFATKCKICGAKVIFEDNGRFFASSDYIGTDICRNCMEKHCNTTNCLGCTIGVYPNCKFLWLKTSIRLEKEDLLECDMNTGKIKVDKSIFDNFVPNSYINIIFTDSESDEMMSFAMISEDDEGIFMEALV